MPDLNISFSTPAITLALEALNLGDNYLVGTQNLPILPSMPDTSDASLLPGV